MRPCRITWILCALALLAAPARAVDGYVGAAFGHSSRAGHSLVAGELIWPIDSPLRLNFNVEYFRQDDVRHFTTSLDAVYFGSLRPIDARLTGWIGLGFGLLTRDPVGPRQDTTRDGHVNVIGGLGFEGPVMPFVQVKLAARRPTWLIGVRFAL